MTRAVKCFQSYTSEQRADRRASHRLGYRQRQAIGEAFWIHGDVPGIAFRTRKAAEQAAAQRREKGEVAA